MVRRFSLVGLLWTVGLVSLFVVSSVSTSWSGAQAPGSTTSTTVSPYEPDPKGLVAHVDRLRRHSLGTDVWQVWVCELEEEKLTLDPEELVEEWEREIRPYFWWLSDKRYNPVFVAGGEPVSANVENTGIEIVEMACAEAVEHAVESGGSLVSGAEATEPNGVIIVVNSNRIGPASRSALGIGSGMSVGDPCLEPRPAAGCDSFPGNGRYVMVAGGRLQGSDRRRLLVAHEMGHTIGFPHSHASDKDEYDNPMDMMSNASRHEYKDRRGVERSKLRVGTIGVNRYQAGWVDPGRVVDDHPGGVAVTYALVPPGFSRGKSLLPVGTLPELMAFKRQAGVFVSLGARVAEGYDSEIAVKPIGHDVPTGKVVAAGQEGVEAYVVDQRTTQCGANYSVDGACISIKRATTQSPANGLSTDHVYGVDQEFVTGAYQFGGLLIPGFGVHVVERVNDAWLLRVTPPSVEAGPFNDISGNSDRFRIELLKWLDITSGCGSGVGYCPSRVTNRAEMAVFLVRALGEDPVPKTDRRRATFRDVLRSFWAWGYIEKLSDLGYTKGCGRSTAAVKYYCPVSQVTNGHVAVFVVRALEKDKSLPTAGQTFGDVPPTHWAYGHIERLEELDIAIDIEMRGKRYFSPDEKTRRDDAAVRLTQAAVTLQDVSHTPVVDGDAPSMPLNVTVGGVWDLSWDPPAASSPGPTVGYEISYGLVDGRGWVASVGDTDTMALYTWVVSNRGKKLYAKVRAYNNHGASGWTATETITAPPIGLVVPSAPTNVKAVSNTAGRVTLTWNPPTIPDSPTTDANNGEDGDEDLIAIVGYRILRKPVGDENTFEVIAANTADTATTYTDTTVTPGVRYRYRIHAINKGRLISTQGSTVEVTVKSPPTTTTTTAPTTTTTEAATGLTLSVSDATATEGETMVFNVSLNKEPLGVQVVVNYQSQPVTATAGTDYIAPSGTFIFGPYDTRKTIRVGIRDDNRTEETETFQIILSQPYGATITKPIGTGTITDND